MADRRREEALIIITFATRPWPVAAYGAAGGGRAAAAAPPRPAGLSKVLIRYYVSITLIR
jgi:hypothetical protein